VTNPYIASSTVEDKAKRIHIPFGYTVFAPSLYMVSHTDVLNNIASLVLQDNENGGNFYNPSLEDSVVFSVTNWDLFKIMASGKVFGEGSIIPLTVGAQGGLGVIGIKYNGDGQVQKKNSFHEPAVLWWGINAGLTHSSSMLTGFLIATYDWYYFMNEITDPAINGKRLGLEFVAIPHALQDFKHVHFKSFFRKKFDMDYLPPKNPTDNQYSEMEIGFGVSFLFMASE
jgi:hypothetical protein